MGRYPPTIILAMGIVAGALLTPAVGPAKPESAPATPCGKWEVSLWSPGEDGDCRFQGGLPYTHRGEWCRAPEGAEPFELLTDSSECPAGQFCQPASGTCVVGCREDGDCPAVERCDEHGACVDPACRTTTLDCAVGEVCDQGAGTCHEADGAYCRPCEFDEDCGDGANFCLDIGAPDGQRYCLVDCEGGPECPRAYSCVELQDGGGSVIGEVCYAQCWVP